MALLSGVFSQLSLKESGPELLRPGETLELTCTVTGGSVTSSYYWNWIRQTPGKGLEWMGYWSGSTYYAPSFRDRITISVDPSQTKYFLRLTSLTAADTAMYYCARGTESGYFDLWGKGTQVTVSSASPTAPTLFPLIPLCGSFPDSGDIAIGCLAKDFLPDSITFSWDNQNNVSIEASKYKKFPSISGTSGTFTASSQANVPVDVWKRRSPFYCKADHTSGNKVIQVIARSPKICPTDMAIRAPPVKAFSSSYLNATITCDAVGLSNEQTTLRWLRNGKPWDSGVTTTKPVSNSQDSCYSMRSELVVTRRDWLADVEFSCHVQNTNYDNILNISKRACCGDVSGCVDSEPYVDTIAPTYADIYQTGSAKLTCRISNIPYEQDLSELNVTWTQGSNHKTLETVFDQPIEQENGMQSIDATATICAADWNSGQTFSCKVSFPGLLPKPVEKQLKKENGGTLYTPSVYVLPPPSDQLALRELATLTCLVKGFYPKGIFVKWLHNNQPVNTLQYFTSQPSQESKQPEKYFAYSMLNINEQDWSAGDTFTCVVGHEALPFNNTQKTVDRNTGKPSIVNVSLVLSDTGNTCYSYLDGIVDTEEDEELQNISSILSTFIILFLVSLFYSATVTVIKYLSSVFSFPTVSTDTPVLFPLLSCCNSDNREAQGSVTFGCLLFGFLPKPPQITWEPDSANKMFFPSMQNGKPSYSTSKVTVPFSEFSAKSYRCRVERDTDSQSSSPSAVIRYKDCNWENPKPVQVHILTPNCGVQEITLELVCLLRSLGPGKASVEWLRNGDVEPKSIEVELIADEDQGSYSSFVRWNISKQSWDKGDLYTCKVTRPPNSQNVTMYNTSKCQACSMTQPIISITKPSYRNLLEGTASVTCSVVGSNLENTQIIWQVDGDGKPSPLSQRNMVKTDPSGSQSVISTHPISLEQWRKGTTLTCKVTGYCYEDGIKEVTVKKDAHTTKPFVAISRASLDISLKSAMALILICDVSGFSPEEISISWKKNDIPLNEKLYDNAIATATGDIYTTYSILKIGRDEPGGKGGSYSCVVYHSSSDEPITASENVPIELFEPKAPTVELLQSVDRKKKTMVLKCIASNYRPQKVSIQWKGGPQNKNETFVEQNMADGTFWASSQFKIPLSQWQDVESNTCEVVHKETNFTVVKKTSRKDWIMPTALTLTLNTTTLCPSTGLGNRSSVTLLCSIYGFSLEKIQVTWEVGGKALQKPKPEIYQQNGNHFYTGSNLTVPLKEWNKLQEYTCKVTQPEANNIQTAKISKCTVCKDSILPPNLYLLKPPLEMLVTQRKALLTCLVVGYELDHAMLTWMVNDLNHTKDARTGNVKNHPNQTQTLESHLNITSQVWDSGSKIQCVLSHPCALFPDMNISIQKCKDSNHIKEPSLSLVIPSATQLMQPTNQAVAWLACMISGFSPAEILVRWKKNNRNIDTSEYITGPPVAETGNPTFTIQSILKVPASEWESRALYTCLVGHESLSGWKNTSRNLYDFLEPSSPQVMAFHTSEDREGQKLVCFATNFYPKNIDIQWHVKGHHFNCSSDTSSLVLLANGKFQKSCHLVLSEEEWSKPEKYTCIVNHSSTNALIKKDLHSSGMVLTLSNETAIKMQLPSFEELFKNKSAALTCMAPNKNTTTNATFSWAMDGEPVNASTTIIADLEESNSTSWIYGQLWVNLTEWRNTTEFTCSIPGGLTETKSRWNGTMKPPKVYLQHQSSSEDLNITLLCMAEDFYPGEIFLEWKEENKGMSLKGYDVHGLKCDHNKQKCSLMSILEVPATKWMMGVSYTCLVAHISSENFTVRRASSLSDSWDCAVMGAALCDVRNENEDEYSELEEANSVWNKVSTFMVLFVVALFYGGLVTFIKVK
ncbi:uncharacterized protein LOC121933921 [Sceloporus undulatus]|uniref:uncharacterized protein LOC121933921 n=1 Tax=Sceloporus undulatus TaxID=8520 RepID=UPI001C4C0D31|nr:uncharacterized protein LOC121933921 [Sceloporus undulatus]